jgi:hypothetical protein
MKKLMITSALAGLLVGGNAIAQTTISGEIRVSLKASGSEATGGTVTSGRGFGVEQQINFANKGKLNVGGLDYAAGFSLENDGVQTTSLFNENNYIDITNAASGTTLSFSQDHIQRSDSDRSAAVIVGFSPNELASGGIGSAANLFDQTAGPGVGASQSVAILQKLGNIGTLSYNYAPTLTDQSTTTTTTGAGSSETFTENAEKSAYEVGFTGNLGVTGLDVAVFKSKQKQKTGMLVQAEGEYIGVRYNMGQVTAGVARKVYNDDVATVAAKEEKTEKHYGLAYAVNKDLSVSILHATGENSLKTTAVTDQKVTAISLGYNLGPVALVAGVAQNENIGGVAGQDSDVFYARLIGAF